MKSPQQIAFVTILACASVISFAAERYAAATDEIQDQADPGDYILVWQVAGPFASEQTPDSPSTLWRDVQSTNRARTGWIDLTPLNDSSDSYAYARTQLWSDVEQAIQFHFTSTNDIKIRINEETIPSIAQDIVRTTLRQGWNTLMLRVLQSDGEQGFACRVLDPTDLTLPGVRVDPLARTLAPPSDVVVLFDGSEKSAWRHEDGSDLGWRIEQGELVVEPGAGDAFSRDTFKRLLAASGVHVSRD